MLYHAYEYTHAAITPMRSAAKVSMRMLREPINPFAESLPARTSAAMLEMFISATKRYGKPEFGVDTVEIDGTPVAVAEEIVLEKPFCNLLHFRREGMARRKQPAVLIVAPMSGHFATLLRGTVKAMLVDHDVFVTDWIDARDVPLSEGRFGLDDYIDYVREFCGVLHATRGERPAVMAVCQPGVPVLAAAALMAEDKAPERPASIVLMGSPIDTTRNPTEPNVLATTRPLSWFEKNVIVTVPFPNMGFLRRVYPGFLQLSGFMQMNLDRHVDAHVKQFQHLVEGDGESADAHTAFYDEYRSVMDMTAEFYLETIETVFQKHSLPRGVMMYRGEREVRPEAITDIALMTVEGEKDDITGRGQTAAAHVLSPDLPGALKFHWEQPGVGHYGVFNGSRFRDSIRPRIVGFLAENRDGALAASLNHPAPVEPVEAAAEAAPAKVETPPSAPAVAAVKATPAPVETTQAAAARVTPAPKAAPAAAAEEPVKAAQTAPANAARAVAAKPTRRRAAKAPAKAATSHLRLVNKGETAPATDAPKKTPAAPRRRTQAKPNSA
ncbi:MAG: polyhydroxyalkanoate depolymerase [Paracoccaceae bacterium]